MFGKICLGLEMVDLEASDNQPLCFSSVELASRLTARLLDLLLDCLLDHQLPMDPVGQWCRWFKDTTIVVAIEAHVRGGSTLSGLEYCVSKT